MSPEERRKAQVNAMANTPGKRDTLISSEHLRDLLAYFDEHEPEVADAIRYGLKPEGTVASWAACMESVQESMYRDDSKLFTVKYPPGHAKNT